jgi:hypothetical protein
MSPVPVWLWTLDAKAEQQPAARCSLDSGLWISICRPLLSLARCCRKPGIARCRCLPAARRGHSSAPGPLLAAAARCSHCLPAGREPATACCAHAAQGMGAARCRAGEGSCTPPREPPPLPRCQSANRRWSEFFSLSLRHSAGKQP